MLEGSPHGAGIEYPKDKRKLKEKDYEDCLYV